MRSLYLKFIRGVSANGFSKTGVAMVTSVIIAFVFFEFLRLTGILTNTYIGLITYLAFPVLFVIGLLLIPFGWFVWKKRTGKHLKELLTAQFGEEELTPREMGNTLVRTVGLLTLLNLVIIGVAGSRMLHFMDEPNFCGTACHSVMNPEWVTYQQSPHARVKCVECHVGEGVDALIDSKLNGIWQMISVTFSLYEQPIPTPVHQLRPARETCEKCHWPDIFLGNRIKNRVHYALDSTSTARYTTLMMKVGAGVEGLDQGSHWHVAKTNAVRYSSVNDEREQMHWAEVRQEDGSFKRFTNSSLQAEGSSDESRLRTMDCVDCHNRATHIYENPEAAVDVRIQRGMIDRSLPYLKREMLGALLNEYPDKPAGLDRIETGIRGFYTRDLKDFRPTDPYAIENAVNVTKAIYERNIHQMMNITWGSYPNHIGHRGDGGCFRCHNQNMKDENGNTISMDCTLCHSILAMDSESPYQFLKPVSEDSTDIDAQMHRYLMEEIERTSSD